MAPLFRRKDPVATENPVSEAPAMPEYPLGEKPCTRAGCEKHTGNPCAYVDRRARRCETAWCEDHRSIIGGAPYCPRHAGIMTALLASSRKGHLPDIDNRAPSLANWVGNDIDEKMREAMGSIQSSDEGETLVVDPIAYVYSGFDQSHRWERAWKIVNHTGVKIKVAVDVDESKDYVVRLRVGQKTVNQVIPPWVGHHEKREWTDPATDQRERTEFYGEVCGQLSEAILATHRDFTDRPYYGSNA
jgi:hypothetical protein